MQEERKEEEDHVFELANHEDDFNIHSGDKLNHQTSIESAKI